MVFGWLKDHHHGRLSKQHCTLWKIPVGLQKTYHQGMTSGMSGMTMREEPECIKKWKLEQEEMLKKKDADEEVKI